MISKRQGLILCGVLSAGILLIELVLPLSWDNWVYQTMGWDLIAYGKLPYVGSWDVNFPGIVYLHALAIALFGTSDLGFRIFDTMFEIAACLLLYRLLVRWFPTLVSLLASLIYPLIYVSLANTTAGQRDAFVVFFLLAGLNLVCADFERDPAPRYRTILAGILIASCAVIRPTYGLFSLSVLLTYILIERRLTPRFWNFLWGCGIAFVLMLIPFAVTPHGLQDFLDFTVRFDLDVYAQYRATDEAFLFALQQTGYVTAAYTLLAMIALGMLVVLKKPVATVSRFAITLYTLLVISSIISIFFLHTFQADHFLPLLLLLSPVVALGICSPVLVRRNLLTIACTALLFFYFAYRLYPRNFVHDVIDGDRSGHSPIAYMHAIIDSDSLAGFDAEAEAVQYVKAMDPRKEPVEVICFDRPYIRVKAGLPSATRFTEIVPLAAKTKDGRFTDYQLEWRKEFVETLARVRPAFIVFADNGYHPFSLASPIELAQEIPGFPSLLQDRYHPDTVIRGFRFYRRNE